MAKAHSDLRLVLTPLALADIREALKWSQYRFGGRAAERYRRLIKQAILDIGANPERPGATRRPELRAGARTYHLRHSRKQARGGGTVGDPRHFLLYRVRDDGAIEVARFLHDARDLKQHLPWEYGRTQLVGR